MAVRGVDSGNLVIGIYVYSNGRQITVENEKFVVETN